MIKQNINEIVASSLDNYLVFYNDGDDKKPTVEFYFAPQYTIKYGQTTTMYIEDENDPNNFSIKLVGSDNAKVTSTTFSTSTNQSNICLSLADCLRMNGNFSNVVCYINRVVAELPSNRRYKFRVENMIGLTANFTQYEVRNTPKYGIEYMEVNGNDNFVCEKYNDSTETYFNVTAPFECMNLKYPIEYMISAYSMVNGEYKYEFTNQPLTIVPTTLHKFDNMNFNDYLWVNTDTNYKRLLTNNVDRVYRNMERASFSFLNSNIRQIILLLYSNSGSFIGEEVLDYEVEKHGIREDITFVVNMDYLDSLYLNSVGEFKIRIISRGKQIYEDITYKYRPVCKPNHELYFLNSLGGIDSFNFTNGWESKSKINNTVNYIGNTMLQGDIKELESRKMLKNNTTYTVSARVGKATAEWLREMAQSKWVYYMDGKGDKYTVIIDDMTITTNEKDSTFTVSVDYHRSDNNLYI